MNNAGRYAAIFLRAAPPALPRRLSVTRASRLAEMVFAARACSSAFSTSSRTASRRSQFSARSASSAARNPRRTGTTPCGRSRARPATCGRILPDFLGGEDERGRDEPHERARDAIDGGLRRAAAPIIRRERVEAVLQHVEIERAQIDAAEIVQRVIDAVKFEILVPLAALANQRRRCGAASTRRFPTARHREANRARDRNRKDSRARSETCCESCGRLRKAASSSASDDAHVGGVVLRRHPDAQQIGAPLFADFVGIHDVAERLRHRRALFVERPTVRDDLAVGRAHRECPSPRAASCGTSRDTGRGLRGTRPRATCRPSRSARRDASSRNRTTRRECRFPFSTSTHRTSISCPAEAVPRPNACTRRRRLRARKTAGRGAARAKSFSCLPHASQ